MCSGTVEVELGGTPSLAQCCRGNSQWGTECTDCLVEKACELEWLWNGSCMLGQQVLRMWAGATALCRVSPRAFLHLGRAGLRSELFTMLPGDLTLWTRSPMCGNSGLGAEEEEKEGDQEKCVPAQGERTAGRKHEWWAPCVPMVGGKRREGVGSPSHIEGGTTVL